MRCKIILLSVFVSCLLAGEGVVGQPHLLSEVKMDQSSVYVGQPVQVRVGVYTSTWFTRGVSPGNIKVNGAFTVFFRSVPQSKKVDGKNYAGVELIFNVFPYDDEDILFPALEIQVETPDEGGYKGVPRKIRTDERKVRVKPIPKGYSKNEWLVASGMTVKDNWSGDLTRVKVGDVLKRSISRKVSGTVSELIPPIVWDTLDGASLYPSRSDVSSEKTKTSISAARTDATQYLFEKEGTFIVPEMVLTWWDPEANKLYKRTLKNYTINVLPNPDLGMLETVRDSLAVVNASEETDVAKSLLERVQEKISWQQVVVALVIVLIIIRVVFKIVKWTLVTKAVIKYFRKRKKLYRESEKYYFRKFLQSARKKDGNALINALYRWIDKLHLKEPTAHYFANVYGNKELRHEVEELMALPEKGQLAVTRLNIRNWRKARSVYLEERTMGEVEQSIDWINPANRIFSARSVAES